MLQPSTMTTDVVVIGAGVVGLAVARALALRSREVIVLERHRAAGQETSSRNSGVIHSGIYYPPGSHKARLCTQGRDLLYAYCLEKGIAHQQCGKLIVSQPAQINALSALQQRAIANGITELQWLSATQVRDFEPHIHCAAALFSPLTGILDVHEYITALHGDVVANGGHIAFDSECLSVRSAQRTDYPLTINARHANDNIKLNCRWVINCAGLHALSLLKQIGGYPQSLQRQAYFAKGNYFVYRGCSPFKHLVYPMPDAAGLGIHATFDINGRVHFGPDVEWLNNTGDYHVNPQRSADFYAAIREYWPSLADNALQPGYAGIRPKLVGPSHASADFVIEGPTTHGLPGLINLLGIESPGLTASLALANKVSHMVLDII